MKKALVCAIIGVLIGVASGCGGGSSDPAANAPGGDPPPSSHVVLVMEENHSYSEVIGNSAMPYLNSLASQYASATQYFADAHPSIADYFMITTGKTESMDNTFTGTVSDDNVVRELVKANKSWHCYAESMPSSGYMGADVAPYLKHHNPFVYLSDVIGTSEAGNVIPFSQFATDLSSGTLPNYSFIVPNIMDDAHDGTLAAADQWLQANIDPLIKSASFQSDGLLIITFDEGNGNDNAHVGGQVPLILVGPKVKKGYQSSTFYQHESTLRMMLQSLGVNSFPGASAGAPKMGEFFQ